MLNTLLKFGSSAILSKVVFVVVTLIITVIVAILLNRFLKKSYSKSISLRKKDGEQNKIMFLPNEIKFNIFRRCIISIVYIAGLLLILSAFLEFKKISYSIFAGAGVEIPFPYRTIVEKKDLQKNKKLKRTE